MRTSNKTEIEISFGEEPTYVFQEIKIDDGKGFPIIIEGHIVGGILLEKSLLCNKWVWATIKGIEIKEVFRKKGIGKKIIETLKQQTDLITGACSLDNKRFWESRGANMREVLEKEYPAHLQGKVEEKFFGFWITDNKKVLKYLKKQKII